MNYTLRLISLTFRHSLKFRFICLIYTWLSMTQSYAPNLLSSSVRLSYEPVLNTLKEKLTQLSSKPSTLQDCGRCKKCFINWAFSFIVFFSNCKITNNAKVEAKAECTVSDWLDYWRQLYLFPKSRLWVFMLMSELSLVTLYWTGIFGAFPFPGCPALQRRALSSYL